MDIKYVGSGEAAKALVYYVTDYITKSTLPAHVGLAAVEYAIKQNTKKFDMPSAAPPSEQVKDLMSYLVGGGDHYCSHPFKTVRWGDFDRHVTKWEGTPAMDIPDDLEDGFDRSGGLELATDVADYQYRSRDPEFDRMSIWEHSEWVTKISQASETKRLEAAPEPVEGSTNRKRGKKANLRGTYEHPHQHKDSHVARMRSTPVVPVLLGDPLPRPDRSNAEYERWCRSMLILFKPWRGWEDLKGDFPSWEAAFNANSFSSDSLYVMRNMNVENECKDARDEHDKQRRCDKDRGATAVSWWWSRVASFGQRGFVIGWNPLYNVGRRWNVEWDVCCLGC
ncbi:hypothetical protein B0H11DRAFT_1766031 [Mycena galericulata]|nr:hypothetical protein B0H11DRAFT_1766031 [Mycena galericulata]